MKKKSIIKNYLYNLIYQLLVLVLPFITVPYVSRVLGAEGIGVYAYTISITLYFITFGSLGIALYGQRETAIVRDNKKEYSKLFYEVNILRLITISISMLLFFLAFVLRNSSYSLYFGILLLEILANIFDISWFFQGLEEFKKTVVRNIVVKLLSIISIFLFVKTVNDVWVYVLIYALSVLIGNVSLWFYLPKYLTKVEKQELNLIKHLKPTLALFIPQIAVQVYTLLDKTMIGTIIDGKSEVGYYDQAQKIIKLLLTIITSMGTVMMPRIAYTYSQGDKDKIDDYINNSLRLVFMLALPMMVGICLISDIFVPIFFGEGYEVVSLLMKVISPIILFIGLSNVMGTQYLLPIKRTKEFTLSVVAGATTNFVLNMLLIPKHGALGASIGTIAAELVVTLVQFIFVRNDINVGKAFSKSKTYIIASLLMFVAGIGINYLLGNRMITMIIQLIVCALIYGTTLLIMKDELLIKIKNRIVKA